MTSQALTSTRDAVQSSSSTQVSALTAAGSPPSAENSPRHEQASAGTSADRRLVLDYKAIDEAKRGLDQGALMPRYGPWRNDIIQLLNDSVATELVCAQRYKRHHFAAGGLASPRIAEEFMVHANEETAHAGMLAKRIVELGGKPDFSPGSLAGGWGCHSVHGAPPDLKAMIKANLIAERVAIWSYSQMIVRIGDKDSTTRRLIEEILSDEQAHAEELRDWLAD